MIQHRNQSLFLNEGQTQALSFTHLLLRSSHVLCFHCDKCCLFVPGNLFRWSISARRTLAMIIDKQARIHYVRTTSKKSSGSFLTCPQLCSDFRRNSAREHKLMVSMFRFRTHTRTKSHQSWTEFSKKTTRAMV